MSKTINLLDKPLEEITREDLKKGIQEKFESVVRFAALAEYSVNPLKNALNAKLPHDDFIRGVYKKAREIENTELSWELSEDKRIALRNQIFKRYKNTSKFIEENPEFKPVWISGVINGKVKNITKKVRKFAIALNVQI